MIRWTATQDGPVIIRYGKDGCCMNGRDRGCGTFVPGKWDAVKKGKDLILLATGGMVKTAVAVSGIMQEKGIDAGVINCSSIKPLDEEYLKNADPSVPFYTLEEHMITGGFGEYVTEKCRMLGTAMPVDCIGVPDRFIPHGSHEQLLKEAGLSPELITERILETFGRKNR